MSIKRQRDKGLQVEVTRQRGGSGLPGWTVEMETSDIDISLLEDLTDEEIEAVMKNLSPKE